jgi:hypothetical protein
MEIGVSTGDCGVTLIGRKKDQDPARIRKRFCRRPPFSGGLEERKCLLRREAQPVKMIPIAKDASACTRKRRSMKP